MFPFAPVTRLFCVALISLAAVACAGKESASNPPPFSATTPIEDTDVAVSANVMAALQTDALTRDAKIETVVRKGDVRLIGRVQDAARRERAETIARGVSGVHSIHNELTVGAAT